MLGWGASLECTRPWILFIELQNELFVEMLSIVQFFAYSTFAVTFYENTESSDIMMRDFHLVFPVSKK